MSNGLRSPSRCQRALASAGVAFTAAQTLGCWAINNREGDLDRSPVVNTGAGASIIYPGQSAPMHPGNYHPREAGYGQGVMPNPGAATGYAAPAQSGSAPPAPSGSYPVPPGAVASQVATPPPEYASGSGNSSGAAAPRGSNITMLGGSEVEETRHVKINEEPKFLKYLALPFAVLAAPIKYGADKMAGDPVPGPAVPRNDSQARPELQRAPAVTDYETARLQGIDRELAERAAPGSASAPVATPAPSTAATTGASSFADELAALRRRASPQPATAPAPVVAAAPPIAAAPPVAQPVAEPMGQVDRDGDGRTDQWITRENGAIARESFDENFDGKPDRRVDYDPSTHEAVLIEEDTNFDGRSDAWTALRGGQVVGRRVDANGDGQIDSWSLYHAGVITRLERDKNGDGFRDHVATYQDGRLAREERDDDGDGRTDLVTYFDAGEQVSRVEEDANGDGQMDVVSYYEGGRLTRREVLDTTVLGAGQPRTGTEVQ